VDEFLMPLSTALGWAISSSLKGTVLIGLVVILGHFLKVASAARLRYALWLPVLLGLLCPFGPSVRIGGFGNFAGTSLIAPRVESIWRESKPRVLIPTDGLSDEVTRAASADAARNLAVQPSAQRTHASAPARYSAALGWIAVV
jgi:hypothetical protein